MRSMLFSNFGSMFNVAADNQVKQDNWDEESLQRDDDDASDHFGHDSDDNVQSTLLRQDTNVEKEATGEQLCSVGLEGVAAASRRGSLLSIQGGDGPVDGELVHATALVSHSVFRANDVTSHQSIGLATEKQPKTAPRGPSRRDLFEPGVKHALIVGVGLQILQQFFGINGVLYYTPQILEQAGVGVLLSNLGLGSESASLLISGLTTLLMLPSIL